MDGETGRFFRSEDDWPFVLREQELEEAISFLDVGGSSRLRVLKLLGPSGVGKSFFARELLVRIAQANRDIIALYLDTPPSDLEASRVIEKLGRLLSKESDATRQHPISLSKKMASKLKQRKLLLNVSFLGYLYGVFRDLVAQIPIAGPFVKAILPVKLPTRAKPIQGDAALFLHCLELSHNYPVVFALDNTQFLPSSVLEILDQEFERAGAKFRLIVLERTNHDAHQDWQPQIANAISHRITLKEVSEADTQVIVETVLPNHEDPTGLANSLYRRSEGNLKAIWFQLKFICNRFELGDELVVQSGTYENVVRSLPPLDQFILRTIVILLGGLSVVHLVELLKAANLGADPSQISWAINDMMAMGLLVLNSETHDKIRVEHERVASVVTDLTPEEEKLELREQIVQSIVRLLASKQLADEDVLYDRLIGSTHESEVRASPQIQAHIVNFIHTKQDQEQFAYLSTLGRDTVCWDIVDILPSSTIAVLLNAIQRCALFGFGLILAEKCKKVEAHRALSNLYEAKYLIQLFRYEIAQDSLKEAKGGPERDLASFNILINLNKNDEATDIAQRVYSKARRETCSEFEYAILRSAGHLFSQGEAIEMLQVAVSGFQKLGSDFGAATTLSNLAIVEMLRGQTSQAEKHLKQACDSLQTLLSTEIYQPLVNLSALALMRQDFVEAAEFLKLARDDAPRTLAMDALMFDYNDLALAIVTGKISGKKAYQICLQIHHKAQKTKDIRFIETLGWFTNELAARFDSGKNVPFSEEIMARVLNPKLAGLELFFSTSKLGPELRVPYILSPHWRY